MKKTYFLLTLLASLFVSAQAQWQMLNTGFPFYLFDVECVDQNTVFLTSGQNTAFLTSSSILKTTDGGKTWVRKYEKHEGDPSVRCIEFADSNVGYAGWEGLLKTTDGGETWVELDISTYAMGSLQDIYAIDADTLFVHSLIKLYKSTDGGQSWTEKLSLPQPARDEITDIFFIDNVGYLASEQYIFKSVDYGETWEIKVTSSDFGEYIYGSKLYFQDTENGKAFYGRNGYLLKTTDGLESYEIIRHEIFCYEDGFCFPPSRYEIKFLSPQYGCAVGYDAMSEMTGAFTTEDGGSTWQLVGDGYEGIGENHLMSAVDGTGESTFFIATGYKSGSVYPAGFIYTNSTTVGMEEQLTVQDIRLHPNPAKSDGQLTLACGEPLKNIAIYDLRGALVKTIEIADQTLHLTLDTAKLRSGIYILQAQTTKNQIYHEKIILY
ncbi:MAG: T9SS type A sorting domain-containing protein [Lentimicrobiaceae bacterium]|jgi:photosystem II stability/assembly factor-like uncharacterized protein|nr:T9SS type A sorting domain-containing protein [Lentimicrobiaceae bacterium]